VRDPLQAPDGQSDVHYQALNYRAFMCGVFDFHQIGYMQPSLKFYRYRHHFEELCSPREKISTRLPWFVHDSHDAARLPQRVRDRIPFLGCEPGSASRGDVNADRQHAAKQLC
jgi:hypothetical protein